MVNKRDESSRADAAVTICGIALIIAGLCVLGYQIFAAVRDGGWTNLSLSDVFDFFDISAPRFVGGPFRAIVMLILKCPISVALIVSGVALMMVYGSISDALLARKEARYVRQQAEKLTKGKGEP